MEARLGGVIRILFIALACWVPACGGGGMESLAGRYNLDIDRMKQDMVEKAERESTNELAKQVAVAQAEVAATMLEQLPAMSMVLEADGRVKMNMGLQQTEGTWAFSEGLDVIQVTLPESTSDMGKIMIGKIDGDCVTLEGTGSSDTVMIFCRDQA